MKGKSKQELFSFSSLKASIFKQFFLKGDFLIGCHLKSKCWDPKDGELYLSRIKSWETMMEVRINTDVQIVCQIWV
jgi:hypothetical protein